MNKMLFCLNAFAIRILTRTLPQGTAPLEPMVVEQGSQQGEHKIVHPHPHSFTCEILWVRMSTVQMQGPQDQLISTKPRTYGLKGHLGSIALWPQVLHHSPYGDPERRVGSAPGGTELVPQFTHV